MASKKFEEFASAASWAATWYLVGYDPALGASVDGNKRVLYSALQTAFASSTDLTTHIDDETVHITAAQNSALDASASPSAGNPYLTQSGGDTRYHTKTVQDNTDTAQNAKIDANEAHYTGVVGAGTAVHVTTTDKSTWNAKVSSVTQGDRITVDNTDPQNPIISADEQGGGWTDGSAIKWNINTKQGLAAIGAVTVDVENGQTVELVAVGDTTINFVTPDTTTQPRDNDVYFFDVTMPVDVADPSITFQVNGQPLDDFADLPATWTQNTVYYYTIRVSGGTGVLAQFSSIPEQPGGGSIGDLTDVDISGGVLTNQILKWDGNNFVPEADEIGSGSSATLQQWDIAARTSLSAGPAEAVPPSNLTLDTPVSGDRVLGWEAGGELVVYDASNFLGAASNTDLSITARDTNSFSVASSTGDNAIMPAVTELLSGVVTGAQATLWNTVDIMFPKDGSENYPGDLTVDGSVTLGGAAHQLIFDGTRSISANSGQQVIVYQANDATGSHNFQVNAATVFSVSNSVANFDEPVQVPTGGTGIQAINRNTADAAYIAGAGTVADGNLAVFDGTDGLGVRDGGAPSAGGWTQGTVVENNIDATQAATSGDVDVETAQTIRASQMATDTTFNFTFGPLGANESRNWSLIVDTNGNTPTFTVNGGANIDLSMDFIDLAGAGIREFNFISLQGEGSWCNGMAIYGVVAA